MTPKELQARCAFLERELGEVSIQLDAAQKRLKLVVEAARIVNSATWGSYTIGRPLEKAIAAWDAVPGDEGRKLHDTEGR